MTTAAPFCHHSNTTNRTQMYVPPPHTSHASAIRALLLLPGQDGLLGAYKQAEALARRKHKWPTGEDYLGSTAAAAAAANGVPGGAADYSLATDGGGAGGADAAAGLAGGGGGSWLVIRDRCAEKNGKRKTVSTLLFLHDSELISTNGCVPSLSWQDHHIVLLLLAG